MTTPQERDVSCVKYTITFGAFLSLLLGVGMQESRETAPLGAVLIMLAIGGFLLLPLIWAANFGSTKAPTKLGGFDRSRFSKPKIVIRPRLRCPFCHDGLTGQTCECPGCKATYHEECLNEARGCVTLGCKNRAPKRAVRA